MPIDAVFRSGGLLETAEGTIPALTTPLLLCTADLPAVWIAQAAVQAKTKLGILLQRLGEDSSSYNRLILDNSTIDKAFDVLLVLECAAAVDFLKIHEFFQANPPIALSQQNHVFTHIVKSGNPFHFVDMAVTLALSTHLLHLDPEMAMLLYALKVFSRYRHLELQEEYALDSFTTNPMRGQPTTQFIAEEGYDCSIYQIEPIGEAEWVYLLTCRHRFHKYCLAKWLEERDTCPLCRRILVQRPLGHEDWDTGSEGSTLTFRAFTDPGRQTYGTFERRRASMGPPSEYVRPEAATMANRYVQILRDRGIGLGELMNTRSASSSD